jgi:site-specific DNA-methyltransferase (adenine-specific)
MHGRAHLVLGNALDHYAAWPTPAVIVSDGAYGVGGFPGDPNAIEDLAAWYEPHVAAWAKYAAPSTTLWFWGTEIGWATVHPVLDRHRWEYRGLHVWDKGPGHIAGNANSKTLRKFPIVTEVCAQYVHRMRFEVGGASLTMKQWLRREWERSGLPLSLANEACGVKNAATRKYFTRCHLWYCPPPEAFERIVDYINQCGDPAGRPYFSIDGERPLTGREWGAMRAKFHCEVGVTNVWREPSVRDKERFKDRKSRALHSNQKPLKLMERIVGASSDPGDTVWEPFGGLCSAAIAALRLGRGCFSAEIVPAFYALARRRIDDTIAGLLSSEGRDRGAFASAHQLTGDRTIG